MGQRALIESYSGRARLARHCAWLLAAATVIATVPALAAGRGQAKTPPPVAIEDRFGRDLRQQGITLVDWEGHIANPAIELTVRLGPNVNLPARVRLSADGPRLMFDLFSDVGTEGPVKVLFFPGPSRTARVRMSVFPDRDGVDEAYVLRGELTTGVSEQRSDSWPLKVIDQDRDRAPEARILLDYRHDATGFFQDQRARRILEQAVGDWAYFMADAGTDAVPAGTETAWLHEPTTFERGRTVTNAEAYSGFLLFAQGIQGPEKRSGGRASDQGGLQNRAGRPTGLRRSGTVIAEVTGNWNALGWSMEESDDRWWVSANHARQPHDFYSIIRHEVGHALLYHTPHPGFARLVRGGRLRAADVRRYLGKDPRINPVHHLTETVDPVSRVGVFGNEYGGDMPRKRWMITKLDLLVARAAGYRLRETSPLTPLRLRAPREVRVRSGSAVRAEVEASGGIPSYFIRAVRGRLPDGVTLDGSTGLISGVPRTAGRARVTIEARDNDLTDPRATAAITFVVEP